MIHALITLAVQVLVGLVAGDWVTGGAVMAGFYVGRELAQAEYRWIEKHGWGLRANMPWWGMFDRRVWNLKSLLDFALPIIVVGVVAVIHWS